MAAMFLRKPSGQAELEVELALAEGLATPGVIAKFKADYDADLRKDYPSMRSKFQYGYVLCCSASRGQTRRGIELLRELQQLLQREIRAKPAAAKATGAHEEEDEAGFVILDKALLEARTNESNDADKTAKGAVEARGEDEEEAKEEEEEPEGKDNGEAEAPHMRAASGNAAVASDAELLEQCLYFVAVGYYRLGDYQRAMLACDDLLAFNAQHPRAACLRDLARSGAVSRRALGFLLTFGVAVPAAYLWHRRPLFLGD